MNVFTMSMVSQWNRLTRETVDVLSLETLNIRLGELWATWSSWGGPCSLQWIWARWPSKFLPTKTKLWFPDLVCNLPLDIYIHSLIKSPWTFPFLGWRVSALSAFFTFFIIFLALCWTLLGMSVYALIWGAQTWIQYSRHGLSYLLHNIRYFRKKFCVYNSVLGLDKNKKKKVKWKEDLGCCNSLSDT